MANCYINRSKNDKSYTFYYTMAVDDKALKVKEITLTENSENNLIFSLDKNLLR